MIFGKFGFRIDWGGGVGLANLNWFRIEIFSELLMSTPSIIQDLTIFGNSSNPGKHSGISGRLSKTPKSSTFGIFGYSGRLPKSSESFAFGSFSNSGRLMKSSKWCAFSNFANSSRLPKSLKSCGFGIFGNSRNAEIAANWPFQCFGNLGRSAVNAWIAESWSYRCFRQTAEHQAFGISGIYGKSARNARIAGSWHFQ